MSEFLYIMGNNETYHRVRNVYKNDSMWMFDFVLSELVENWVR